MHPLTLSLSHTLTHSHTHSHSRSLFQTTPQSRHKPPLSAAQDNVVDLREELAQKAALRGEKKRGQPNNIEQEQQQDEAVDGLEFDHETSF